MKKLLFVLSIATFFFTEKSSAQTSPMLSSYSLQLDTVTNTATNYLYIASTNSQVNLSVQPVVTKISGTIAGTYYLQGSLDGINYLSVLGDSATATNVATNTKIWFLATKNYKYYRLAYTGTGTMVGTLKGTFYYNNPNK